MDGSTPTPGFTPNEEQETFLSRLRDALDEPDGGAATRLRLLGGPGCGKSYTTVEAAREASDAGCVVFLLAPTHQAVGVLAKAARAAALPVRPYSPDPRVGLRAGQVLTATTHSFAKWTQKARSVSANYGAENPVAKDSWIGRAMKPDWNDPPAGVVLLTDEISMYQWQMSGAIDAMIARLVEDFGRVIHVAIGDPDQLIPVRSASYELIRGESMVSPSRYVVDAGFETITLQTNMRAKHSALRDVVETYKTRHTVSPPPTGQGVYRWVHADDESWEEWVETVKAEGVENCAVLAYRRATVAAANDRMSVAINGHPSFRLLAGVKMRVQETFAPAGQTLYHSSQLIEIEDVMAIDDVDAIIEAILPPTRGHENVHEPETLEELHGLVARSVMALGPVPMAQIDGSVVPAIVSTEHTADTPSQTRWNELLSAVNNAAFRSNGMRERVRRGMTSLFYHLSDAARLKLEPPFAMTSHRAQGSTYPHVMVVADMPFGTRLVDSPTDAVRHSSSYVMLSRASQSLTIMWPAPPTPMSSRGWF
jgi:hypothetical protein